jgi:hypothetical protein
MGKAPKGRIRFEDPKKKTTDRKGGAEAVREAAV